MNAIKRKLHTLTHTPRIFMKKFAASPIFRLLPDKLALKIQYKNTFLRPLNLKNPQTFNEKLQWLKLYNRKPEYSKMVDKYEAKKYVASIIGEEYIIPTYGVYNSFDEIDFEALPNQFVLKCTHGSGDVVICKDKASFDYENARKKLTKSLKTNYYKIGREWPYKNVKPRIIAEKFLDDGNGCLRDYKIFCFSGEAKLILIASDRFTSSEPKFDYFDNNFKYLEFDWTHPRSKSNIPQKPQLFDVMMNLAETLSTDIPHLRVDFYEFEDKVFFGELTFFHAGGFTDFTPDEWDFTIGEWIKLQ